MENLNIPQTLKVQWLNSTLKFIKDDTQLLKQYPKMPSTHVEYFHNLIWQRENNIGLGFKSLYSPVWEAMKIYSVKYQFKIIIEKSVDGKNGLLVMEKIPKSLNNNNKGENGEHNDIEIKVQCAENQNKILSKKKAKMDTKDTKKKLPSKCKAFERYLDNQLILDAVSPLFVKEKLKRILLFLLDEYSSSIIFSDLVGVESRFIENISSLCQRSKEFEEQLSPLSFEMLSDIADCINGNNNFQLEITKKINEKTSKRSRESLEHTEKSHEPGINKSKEEKICEFNQSTDKVLKGTKTVQSYKNEPQNVFKAEKTLTSETLKGHKEKTDSERKIVLDANREDMKVTINNIKSIIPKEKSVAFVKSETKYTDVNEKCNNIKTKDGISQKLSKTAPMNAISFTKSDNVKDVSTDSKNGSSNMLKSKIISDMAVPIKSEKASRMMRLMGWEGGALGLHGNGITEPIIPTANYNCTGLGHVPTKNEKSYQGSRKSIKQEFSVGIMDLINNRLQTVTLYPEKRFIDKEIKFWRETVDNLNKRVKLDRSVRKSSVLRQKMKENPDVEFSLVFSDDYLMMTIIKRMTNTLLPVRSEQKVLKEPTKKKTFQKLILTTFIELLSGNTADITLLFEKQLQNRLIDGLFEIVTVINDRRIGVIMNDTVAGLVSSLRKQVDLKSIYLAAEVSGDYKSVTLYIQNCRVNLESSTTRKQHEVSPYDNVKNNIKMKKKKKIINALYEKKFTDENVAGVKKWYQPEHRFIKTV
ncbi:hypothetical protein KGM_206756 [Danaus plexippus plexippus]|uniref:G-patch domain-containing protein n=1 Tax=Danaus plexippus plexippus TaxID=278856 RepID=A0A212FCX1_DANPL|nr:hypothetical protein KGM_206756 [Danaus plexippus plexippus]